MSETWFVHYRALCSDYKDLIKRGLPPRTEPKTLGPFSAGRALDERQKLLKIDTVFEAHLSQETSPPTPVLTRTPYRGVGG